ELRDVGDRGEVDAFAEIIVGCDRERSELAEAAGDILDVFVQTKDLHRHQDDGRVLHVRRAREVDRHLAVRDFDLRIADGEPGGVGLDRVGAYRPGGERIAGGGRGRGRQEEAAARQRIALTCQSHDIGYELGLSRHTETSLFGVGYAQHVTVCSRLRR